MRGTMHGDGPARTDGTVDEAVADDLNLDAKTKEWLEGTRGFETIEDRAGEREVVVEVGGGNGLTYAPAAIRVDPGTTIRWVWTGNGGLHDVAFVNTDVSASLRGEQGAEYTYTFTEPGEYRYECTPHASVGMRGVVIVEES
jgi:halocyanin-like protein